MSRSTKLGIAAATIAAITVCCTRQPPVSPPIDVQGELVDACGLAGDDSGDFQQAVESGAYPWLTCLAEGGTITGCRVPCE